MEKEELRVLILSAGKIDNELAKIFGEIPSGLIPLNGKPVIFRIIDKLIDEGFEKISITVGSTAAIRILLDTKVEKVPKGLWCYRLHNDYTLLGGSFSEGGNLINWAYNNLKLPKLENLNKELLSLSPGAHGISILPFLLGERALGWSNNSKGIISGLKYSNSSIEILQSFLESISYRLFLVWLGYTWHLLKLLLIS